MELIPDYWFPNLITYRKEKKGNSAAGLMASWLQKGNSKNTKTETKRKNNECENDDFLRNAKKK